MNIVPIMPALTVFIAISVLTCVAVGYAPGARQKSLASRGVAERYAVRLKASNDESNNNSREDGQGKRPNFWTGLAQLMTMGAGAPSLGEFKEIDDRGRAIFELEANNLVDAEGNVIQTRAKFFESGYTAGSEEDIKAPGFFENLLSGGKAMQQWEEERERGK